MLSALRGTDRIAEEKNDLRRTHVTVLQLTYDQAEHSTAHSAHSRTRVEQQPLQTTAAVMSVAQVSSLCRTISHFILMCPRTLSRYKGRREGLGRKGLGIVGRGGKERKGGRDGIGRKGRQRKGWKGDRG